MLSSACRTVPLLLVALGTGLASGATYLQLAPLVGGAAMAALIYRDVRRRNGGVFTLDVVSRERQRIALSVVTFVGAWVVMTALVAPTLGAMVAADPPASRSATAAVPAETVRLRLRIDGMYCLACVWTVQSVLERLTCVYDVQVTFGGASLAYDPDQISAQEIKAAATFYVYEARIEG